MRLSPKSRYAAYAYPVPADPTQAGAIAEIITPAPAERKPIQREARGRKRTLANSTEIQAAIEELPNDQQVALAAWMNERQAAKVAVRAETPPTRVVQVLRAGLETAREQFTVNLYAPNTQRGYRFDWQAFVRWCKRMEFPFLPTSSDALALHSTDMLIQGRKVTTVARRVAAVVHVHVAADLPSPLTREVREVLRGARRTKLDPTRQVAPLLIEQLRNISELLANDGTPLALRNRAILVVGFASALRSANLVSLRLEDAEFLDKGLILTIRRSKTDQEGKGRLIGLPHGKHPETCPVRCLKEWIARRGSFAGPLFTRLDRTRGVYKTKHLDPERVTKIVQQGVKRTGLPWREYGSHSLRAGFITEAGDAGLHEWVIAAQSGHVDLETLRRYFRRRDVFKGNAAGSLDL